MIRPAEIRWREDGAPESTLYGDIYYSREGGLEETRYVFLQHNGLPERFRTCKHFTIAETGFGTGLNFLATWQAFAAHAPKDAALHYISVEKHPLRMDDLQRAHLMWPELAEHAAELQRAYPAPAPGVHRLMLEGGRIRLTLLFGDAGELLKNLSFRADAWYLDGFSPAGNPEMWQEELLADLADHSAEQATFATFTSAGKVRRALEQAGFAVEKVKGFGHKRDMLRGTLTAPQNIATALRPASALVVGAGAAGAAAAYALALRGVEITVLDRLPAPAIATSANAAAILFPFASRAWMPHTFFYLTGMEFTRRQVSQFRLEGHTLAGSFCGMVQCPKPSQEESRLLEIPSLLGLDAEIVQAMDATQATGACGLSLPSGALYWPGSGWYSLGDYARACLAHSHITFKGGVTIDAIERKQGKWIASAEGKTAGEADILVLANAADARHLLPPPNLPLGTVRGQVTHLPVSKATENLRTVLCFGGYLTPAQAGIHHLGATYEHQRFDTDVHEDSHRTNLEQAARIFSADVSTTSLTGWAGVRTTTPDKLPLVGATDQPGLYVTLGHGSRAALSCPLAGEIVAAAACGDPLPITHTLRHAVHPGRF